MHTQNSSVDIESEKDEWMPELISYTHNPPPDLRLVECCCRCHHGRRDGFAVECMKYRSRGISLYAVCDDFTSERDV
jgi:hypothetical protein